MAFFNEGTYRAKIGMAQLTEAKNEKKTPQVEITLELLAELDDKGEEYAPRRSQFPPRIFLALTEATMGTPSQPGWVAQVLAHIGFKGNFEHIAEVEGWEGLVYCSHQEDQNGKEQDRWSINMGERKPQLVPKDKAQIRKLNTLFGKHFNAGKEGEKKGKKPPEVPVKEVNVARAPGTDNTDANPPVPAGATTSDDIPF
jgi:hypothetical protein